MGEKKNGMGFFGVWLKVALFESGMKQKDLAKIMNTSEACVSRWIHSNRVPANKQLTWILDYFNCHIEIVPNEHKR
ncbi:MAG: helix-turn-helix transcriptional regulator [Treponema sp.]|nr:helix-turn-helix transcriptional regulator [Treponema sp.]